MTNFRGAYTALVTPMKEDGDIDYDGWQRLIDFQINEGIDGLVPLGTTGENPTLTDEEEDILIDMIVKQAKGKVKIIVGAGSNSTKHMLFYTERAKKYGADAALVVTPYYNKPNDDGLIKHFEAAAAVGIPIIVYNIASRTGRNIPAGMMEKLANIPGIIGVKESSGDINQMCDIIHNIAIPRKAAGKDFFVLSGDDAFTLPLSALGGDGAISVVSNLLPAKVKALTTACFAGKYEDAKKIHYELLPFIKAAFIETNPAPIKLAMSWAGLPAGPARLPLGNLSEANAAILKKTMKDMGLIRG